METLWYWLIQVHPENSRQNRDRTDLAKVCAPLNAVLVVSVTLNTKSMHKKLFDLHARNVSAYLDQCVRRCQ